LTVAHVDQEHRANIVGQDQCTSEKTVE